MPRLFTALEIPRDAALSLSLLRGGLPGARWIDVENYHLTLRFIGDVEGHVADEIANALDRVHRPSFPLTLSGVGAFGQKKPHAVWAGVAASPDLTALQGEIDRICQRHMRHELARVGGDAEPLADAVDLALKGGKIGRGGCARPHRVRFLLAESANAGQR